MRCIGICGRDDETFPGEWDDCAQMISRARRETEQIVKLLDQDYDRNQRRYFAGQGYRSARSNARFIHWTLVGQSHEQLDDGYDRLEDSEREKERQEAREKRDRELSKQREAELKATLKTAFVQQPGATEARFRAAWPEMLKKVQIEQAMKGLSDPLVGLRDEFDRRFRASRNGMAPPNRVIHEPVPVESEY